MTEIINVIVWPLVTLIAAVIFRRGITDILRRTRKIGIKKIGLETYSAQETQDERRKKSSDDWPSLLDPTVLRDQEEFIKEDLKKQSLDAESDTACFLIRQLAATEIELWFEQAYNAIYGSQIVLLKQLNEVAGKGQSLDFVSSYFSSTKERHPNQFKDWDLERYLSFLRKHLLITNKDDNYHITTRGVGFLVWLARYGLPEDRPF